MASSSLLGLDFTYLRGLIVDHYRATYVYWAGDPFDEPTQTPSGSTPADWIMPIFWRSESDAYNVENAQARENRVMIYGAFQPNRSGLVGRIDAVHADLFDALSYARHDSSQKFTDSYEFIGDAAPPSGLETSQNWLWRAWLTDFETYQQVA